MAKFMVGKEGFEQSVYAKPEHLQSLGKVFIKPDLAPVAGQLMMSAIAQMEPGEQLVALGAMSIGVQNPGLKYEVPAYTLEKNKIQQTVETVESMKVLMDNGWDFICEIRKSIQVGPQ
jgi:hypothetical protein